MTAHSKDGLRPTYNSWQNMKARCDNENAPNYRYYGGRGISYAERWKNFAEFLFDMGVRPEKTTLDRLNSNENYSKENCRWATSTEQSFSKRPRAGSTSGLRGVYQLNKRGAWVARARLEGIFFGLYRGDDFFEACSARKSWEAKNLLATRDE